MSRLTHLWSAIALLITSVQAAEEPLSLQLLEDRFDKRFESGVADLRSRYRQAVVDLSKTYKDQGNLDGILATETELEAIDREIENEAAGKEPTIFQLGTLAASPVAPVVRESKHRLLVSWKVGGGASWDLTGLPAGTYAVTLLYYAGPFAGGELRLRAGTSQRSIEIKGGDRWSQLEILPIGQIQFGDDATRLKLDVTKARALGVFELSAVELVAIGD